MKAVLTLGLLLFVGTLAMAQTTIETSMGEKIAKAAKAAKLNPRASATAEKNGRKIIVTPMNLSKIKTSKDLEKGHVIAVLDIEAFTELPDGKYNVFVMRVNDGWQMFFESDGKILKQDENVQVSSRTPDERKPGTEPVIAMRPNVPPVICFRLHNGHLICIELPFWVNLPG